VVSASQPVEHISVNDGDVALPHDRIASLIGVESKPVEVVEDCPFIFRPAANAIMILDPEEHASAERSRHTPRVYGIDDMPQVKIPSR
jgi:hypothetical protein